MMFCGQECMLACNYFTWCFSDVIEYTARVMPLVSIFVLLEGIGVGSGVISNVKI